MAKCETGKYGSVFEKYWIAYSNAFPPTQILSQWHCYISCFSTRRHQWRLFSVLLQPYRFLTKCLPDMHEDKCRGEAVSALFDGLVLKWFTDIKVLHITLLTGVFLSSRESLSVGSVGGGEGHTELSLWVVSCRERKWQFVCYWLLLLSENPPWTDKLLHAFSLCIQILQFAQSLCCFR